MSEKHAAAATASGSSLAEQIYVELIGRSYLRVENNAQFKPDPATLAKLSIQLALVFEKTEKAHKAESGPKNVGYDVTKLDLGSIGS